MIGAHPDDEDSQLIAWLTRARHVETAYLSLTRGEGGQNLIGNELGPALGIIRTEELLAARRVDGAHQYFSRAIDFGFSKTDSETYTRWVKDSVLKDVVTVVRAFRPHVIIAVFSGTPNDGHGHHQVSGQLAREAFLLAPDTVRFPATETSKLPPWTPLKFYRTARFSPGPRTIVMNVGEYSALLGRSAMEIAAESRSQHMSQGFGILQRKGVVLDSVRLDTSRVEVANREASIFDGIDTSFARFQPIALSPTLRASFDSLPEAIGQARTARDLVDQSKMVVPLARVVSLATRVREGMRCTEFIVPQCGGSPADLAASLNVIRDRASRALLLAAGVSIEATAERELVALGDSVPVTIAVYNRGRMPITAVRGTVYGEASEVAFDGRGVTIAPDSVVGWGGNLRINRETGPWWTVEGGQPGTAMFKYSASRAAPIVAELVSGEDRVTSTSVSVVLRIAGVDVTAVEAPIIYRFADPARGELHRPLAGIPPITLLLEQERAYARANTQLDRLIRVFVHSALGTPQTVRVAINLPRGLRVDSNARTVTLPPFGSTSIFFRAQGSMPPGRYTIFALAHQVPTSSTTASARPSAPGEMTVVSYGRGFVPVEYRHIRPQRFYRAAATVVEAVDVKYAETLNVAYVKGVGDNVEPMLAQLGIKTTVIDPALLPMLDFTKFNALVIGPRAYAANEALAINAPFVLDFARKGGTVVVQYGQNEMTQPGIMPHPITLASRAARVTDETAPVRVLDAQSPLLGMPNIITSRDFEGWVQERALYMPSTFDRQYHPVLSMNDKDEPPNDAGILITPLGKGMYVYTTLSFFRQLPSVNPGAARLFVNLLSADRRGAVP
jgi:LmbE family N-acetylglucosaminyl deacetylase